MREINRRYYIMKDIIIRKLEEELVTLLEELSALDSQTQEYDDQLSKIAKLYKTLNEEQKLSLEGDKVEIEREKMNADVALKRDQLFDGTRKFEAEVDIKKEQLKLDEKRLVVERQKISDDYEIKDRQLINTEENLKEEMSFKNKELEKEISDVIADRDLKLKELKHSTIGNYVRTGVEILAIGAPLVFYGVWMNKGFEFEKEGTITSQTFKGLLGKFKTTR